MKHLIMELSFSEPTFIFRAEIFESQTDEERKITADEWLTESNEGPYKDIHRRVMAFAINGLSLGKDVAPLKGKVIREQKS